MQAIRRRAYRVWLPMCMAMVAGAVLPPALAQSAPAWAVFTPQANTPPPPSVSRPNESRTLPGSARTYTNLQIDDVYSAPDWYPQDHVPMPDIVAKGDASRAIMACASCHLTSGAGHPESAHLAGLSKEYLMQQLQDYRSGARRSLDSGGPAPFMAAMAKKLTDEEIQAAAQWFAGLKPVKWYDVVEASVVPRSYVNSKMARRSYDDATTESLGLRIMELPVNAPRADDRDPRSGFVAYVPVGSTQRGRKLVESGADGKTAACSSCHGKNFNMGVQADIPAIAGRGPSYLVRQLYAFKNGWRGGTNGAIMKSMVDPLTSDEITEVAAFLASLDPAVQ